MSLRQCVTVWVSELTEVNLDDGGMDIMVKIKRMPSLNTSMSVVFNFADGTVQ